MGPKSRRKWPWLVVVVVVLLAAAGAAVWYFQFRPLPTRDLGVTSAENSEVATGSSVARAGAAHNSAADAHPSANRDGATAVTENAGHSSGTGSGTASAAAAEKQSHPGAAESGHTESDTALEGGTVLAKQLVKRGEDAYVRGDYDTAIKDAQAALHARADYPRAQRLLRRSRKQQRQIAARKQAQRKAAEEARQARKAKAEEAEEARAARQAQAAREAEAARKARLAAARPTPDELYGDRAHSECHKGFLGKFCRHKIRKKVCRNAKPGDKGVSVCHGLKHWGH